jgi:EmrB/QacA subfamily drug resistance transporter
MSRHQPPRLGAAILAASLPMAMAAIDDLAMTFALPVVQRELRADVVQLSWVVNGYTLAFATLMLPFAALGDRLGRRRIFVLGIGAFALASVAAALAGSAAVLIAARVVQGAAAAAIVPLSLALLAAAVPDELRALAVGVWSGINGLGIAVGPLLGGAIVDGFHWSGIFWLNVPLGVVSVVAALRVLPESRGTGGRLDLVGVLAAIAVVLPLSWALVSAGSKGWTAPPVVAGIATSGVALLVLVLRGHRRPGTLLPVRLFRDRAFTLANLAGFLVCAGVFGAIFLLSQYLQVAVGRSAWEAGLLAAPWTLAPMVVAPLAGVAVQRFGARPVLVLGTGLQALALALIDRAVGPELDYLVVVGPLALAGIGMGLTFAPLSASVLLGRPEADHGVASALHSCLRQLGMAAGVALATGVFVAHGAYRAGQPFVDGLVAALPLCTGLVALAFVAALFLPGTPPRVSPTSPNVLDSGTLQGVAS